MNEERIAIVTNSYRVFRNFVKVDLNESLATKKYIFIDDHEKCRGAEWDGYYLVHGFDELFHLREIIEYLEYRGATRLHI